MTNLIEETRERFEQRKAELEQELAEPLQELRELDRMLAMLGGQPVITPRAPTRRTGSRDNESERAAKIVQLVQSNPGQHGFKTLADAIGVSTATATKTAKALIDSGQIRSEGEKRGLRLFPT